MKRTKSSGFTLIELMIVVAIVGLLTSIAFGFYGDNVIASNRSDGRTALTAAAGSLEKCKSLYGAYNSVNCGLVLPFNSENNLYQIQGTTVTNVAFTLTAAPILGQPQVNDNDCTTLTLTNTGIKAGTGANPPTCW